MAYKALRGDKMRKKTFWIYYNSFKISKSFCVEEFGRHVNPKGYEYTETRSDNIFHIVTKGVCRLIVQNDDACEEFTLNAGDCFFVKSGVKHTYVSDKISPCTRVWFSFTGYELDDIFKSLDINGGCCVFSGLDVNETESLFERLFENAKDSIVSKFNVLSVVMRLFAMLSQSIVNNNDKLTEDVSSDYAKEFVNTVVKYIDSHIMDKLSVTDIASLFNYETSYLHKLFKKHTGVSVQRFILDRKIHYARKFCVETDMPFSVLAYNLGYNNYASFYKTFVKAVHCSPEQYRQMYRKTYKQ